MEKILILKTQANEIFQAMQSLGLDPSQFAWEEVPSKITQGLAVSRLVHRPTGHYFMFDFRQRKHWIERSPGDGVGVET